MVDLSMIIFNEHITYEHVSVSKLLCELILDIEDVKDKFS